MELDMIHILTIIVATIFALVAVFQMLLLLGYPLGEFAMGGYYKVLPVKLRIISGINGLILLMMGVIFLQHTNVINWMNFISTNLLVWIITIFLGLNTIANVLSRSKKERLVMTPLSGITFILCLIIVTLTNEG